VHNCLEFGRIVVQRRLTEYPDEQAMIASFFERRWNVADGAG